MHLDFSTHILLLDWNTRLEAVSTAIDYFESHSADFEDSIRMNQFLDIYLDRLRDGNGKVQTAALQGFSRVILAAPVTQIECESSLHSDRFIAIPRRYATDANISGAERRNFLK